MLFFLEKCWFNPTSIFVPNHTCHKYLIYIFSWRTFIRGWVGHCVNYVTTIYLCLTTTLKIQQAKLIYKRLNISETLKIFIQPPKIPQFQALTYHKLINVINIFFCPFSSLWCSRSWTENRRRFGNIAKWVAVGGWSLQTK